MTPNLRDSPRSTCGQPSRLRSLAWSSLQPWLRKCRIPTHLTPAVLYATPAIAGMYMLGTMAVLWLVPRGEISIVTAFCSRD